MCLVMSKKYKSYSKEDKLSLLRDYYQSGLSKNSFCKSRGISSIRLLNTWLKVFVNEKELLSLQSEQANITDMAYIKYIRDTYGIPIWFRWFSFEENKLYEGI